MPKIGRNVFDADVYCRMESPVGTLTLLAVDEGLTAVLFDTNFEDRRAERQLDSLTHDEQHPVLEKARAQLGEYFEQRRAEFDLPLVIRGTPFQQRVWRRLLEIPYGETASYQEQALKLGGANKVRAVAGANGKNPLSIVVPCHRVIGKDGSLTGFGGGLSRKKYLLELEGEGRSRGLAPRRRAGSMRSRRSPAPLLRTGPHAGTPR